MDKMMPGYMQMLYKYILVRGYEPRNSMHLRLISNQYNLKLEKHNLGSILVVLKPGEGWVF
jgi:hypothetical protein